MDETIDQDLNAQLMHRTIREFTGEPVFKDTMDQLLEVARRTATSTGLQAASIVWIKDKAIKEQMAEICHQEYVARATELLIFLVDQRRNAEILKELGQDPKNAGSIDKFFQGFTDACLMAQNVTSAAEALGLGAVYLGSILNDPKKTIALLNLPEYTFPVVGVGLGHPAQEPQLKPRMEMDLRVFEDRYEVFEGQYLERLKNYDEEMAEYYDLRESNQRSDSFTLQVSKRFLSGIPERQAMMNDIAAQGFDLKLKK